MATRSIVPRVDNEGGIGENTTPKYWKDGFFRNLYAKDSPWVDVRTYATFSTAIDAIGASEKTLLIPNQQNVETDKTVPANITLKFMQGGTLNISDTKTVTINGHIEAGLYQIFEGDGSVSFGVGAIREAYPQWWGAKGDGATDDSAAITAAKNASPIGGALLFTPGDYLLDSTFIINKTIQIILNGTTIIGPTSGFAFEIASETDGVSIIGSNSMAREGEGAANKGSIIRLRSGSDGAIKSIDSMRIHVKDFALDLADLEGVIGFYQLGGWYANLKNVWTDRDAGAGTYGLQIESVDGSVDPGNNGSYVSIYENVSTARVKILGDTTRKVTTLTFINLASKLLDINNCYGALFLNPVIQEVAGGNFITITNSRNISFVGGDYEGNGNLYTIVGDVRNLTSIGNGIFEVGGSIIYLTGEATHSLLLDNFSPAGTHTIRGTGRKTFHVKSTGSLADVNIDAGMNKDAQLALMENGGGRWVVKHNASDGSWRVYKYAAPAGDVLLLSSAGNFGIGLLPTANMEGLAIEKGLLTLKERTTPTADTNYGKIYTKNDNKLYFQDGAGVEHEISYV